LRAVLVPRPRLEIAELLVVHQVEIGEELDGDAVGVLVTYLLQFNLLSD
jgi:hypothetical protein